MSRSMRNRRSKGGNFGSERRYCKRYRNLLLRSRSDCLMHTPYVATRMINLFFMVFKAAPSLSCPLRDMTVEIVIEDERLDMPLHAQSPETAHHQLLGSCIKHDGFHYTNNAPEWWRFFPIALAAHRTNCETSILYCLPTEICYSSRIIWEHKMHCVSVLAAARRSSCCKYRVRGLACRDSIDSE